MARFQILSLVGGGIRGAFVTALLDRLEQKLGRPIASCFDLIAGTSTGGIIAAGLSAGMSAAEMHDFYVRYGAKIFSPRGPYKAQGVYRYLFPLCDWLVKKTTGHGLASAFRSRFCPHSLEMSFQEGFDNRTMQSVDFTRLIIPAVNLTEGQPHIFRSCHLPTGLQDQDVKIAEVLIAATAAPTYFPHRVIKGHAYVDGGVWAADPSMLAFCEAIRIQQFENGFESLSQCNVNDIHLLSIGTGNAQYSLSPPGDDAGLLYWASRASELMVTSQVHGIHTPMNFLLGNRYRHINFKLEERWGLDEIENLPKLFLMGKRIADEQFNSINTSFFSHSRDRFECVNKNNFS